MQLDGRGAGDEQRCDTGSALLSAWSDCGNGARAMVCERGGEGGGDRVREWIRRKGTDEGGTQRGGGGHAQVLGG